MAFAAPRAEARDISDRALRPSPASRRLDVRPFGHAGARPPSGTATFGRNATVPWRSLATPSMGFVASRRSRCSDRYAGLPHRRLPLSEFLAPSAVCSHCHLVTIFHVTSAHRLLDLQSFSRATSRVVSRRPVLSCRFMSHMLLAWPTCRLQSLTPDARPSLWSALCTPTRAAALLVFPLSEVLWNALRRAGALPSHASRQQAVQACRRASQGIWRSILDAAPESRADLHEVFHLVSPEHDA